MPRLSDYSLTEAMQYCLQQPGVTAASFVDIEMGRKIAALGEASLTDLLIPFLTDWYLAVCDEYRTLSQASTKDAEYYAGNIGEIKVTLGDSTHLIYPLSHNGKGLYLYLSLERQSSDQEYLMPSIRECLRDIDTGLGPLNRWSDSTYFDKAHAILV